VKSLLFKYRWHVAGSVFIGLAVACFEKHGAIEYAADRVWEEVDSFNKGMEACAGTHADKPTE
jgi:hypothetical protein